MQIALKEESYQVMGACFEVYKDKGPGFVEAIYHECLEIEFEERQVPAISKPRLEIKYKGRLLKNRPEPDFVCYGKLILEIKAVKELNDQHRAQLFNYLRATDFEVGILANFCSVGELHWERILKTDDPQKYRTSSEPPRLQS